MGSYLVVGGSRGIGREITVALRERGDLVFTAHRAPPPDHEDLWIETDFLDDSTVARLVRHFLVLPKPVNDSLSVILDGIIVAVTDTTPDSSLHESAFDCRDAFVVNVLAPLMLVKFAKMVEILSAGARVILVDHEQQLTPTNHQYLLSKAAIPEVAHILEASYPDLRAEHLMKGRHELGFLSRVMAELSEVSNA